jgi:predicted kinase
MKATLILVCGLPGAGKTTLAKELADERSAIRFSPDEWMEDLGISLFDKKVRAGLEKRFWKLSQELLSNGQSVALEYGFWGHAEREEMRKGARQLNVAVELYYLDVPLNELRQRLERRGMEGDNVIKDQLEDFAKQFQTPDEAELELYDNHKSAS